MCLLTRCVNRYTLRGIGVRGDKYRISGMITPKTSITSSISSPPPSLSPIIPFINSKADPSPL